MSRRCVLMLAMVVLVSGCVQLAKETPVIHSYAFRIARESADATSPLSMVSIKVRRAKVMEPYDGRSLVYALPTGELRSDYYNEFALFPATMVTTAIEGWLKQVPFVEYVSFKRDMVECQYEIRPTIHMLYADYSVEASPQAVVSVSFTVLDAGTIPYSVVSDVTYEELVPLDGAEVTYLIEGWNSGLHAIFTAFEAELARVTQK